VATREILDSLVEMEKEGILYLYDGGLKVRSAGEMFIRNICAVFDSKFNLHDNSQKFSKAI
jgi:oxygen-independent coproporphyrinogen-3 oxidase